MGNTRPLGSEKLQGSEKLNRILELTYYNSGTKNSGKNAELIESTINEEHVYGIVKEKDGYYVKRGLNESSLDYIGGMFMKNKNRFSSYAEALKRLDFLKGRENLEESTKYVLKQNKPSPMPEDAPMDVPPMPDDQGVPSPDAAPMDTPPSPEMGGEDQVDSTKPSSYMTEVQKLSGKLGQELRDRREEMKSDDIKYALMMIISAVDLEKLEDDDLEEIASKFERDEDFGDEGEEFPSEEPTTDEVPSPEPTGGEEELAEEDPMSALENFIKADAPRSSKDSFNPEDYIMQFDESNDDSVEEVELDLDEISKDISNALRKHFKV